MDMYAYPAQEQHIKNHQGLSDWALKAKARVLQTRSGLTGAELTFLRNWLIEHVAEQDMHMGRFVRDQGYGERDADQSPGNPTFTG